jgi:hypothetical protein
MSPSRYQPALGTNRRSTGLSLPDGEGRCEKGKISEIGVRPGRRRPRKTLVSPPSPQDTQYDSDQSYSCDDSETSRTKEVSNQSYANGDEYYAYHRNRNACPTIWYRPTIRYVERTVKLRQPTRPLLVVARQESYRLPFAM